MKVLFIGDIVGRPGRQAVKKILSDLKKDQKIDLVLANGENLAGGRGMTYETYREMIEAGIDYFTSGNHIWDNEAFLPYLEDDKIKVLRPANYSEKVPGRSYAEIQVANRKILIANLLGQVLIGPEILVDNAFLAAQSLVANTKSPIIIIDFHAEATSEKAALGYYLDGKVSALIGTHTHVQTADSKILPKGTAFISDVGMVGPAKSSIGLELSPVIEHFLTGLPFKGETAKSPCVFNAVILDIDDKTGKAKKITPINKIVE